MEIYNDDCLNILPKLGEDSVDLVLVDLPYGCTKCAWDIQIDLQKMWTELKRVCKSNTTYCFFTTSKFGYELIKANPKWFKYDLVWEKTSALGFLSANKMPLRAHEMIYIFGNPIGGKKTYNPQKTMGKKPYIHKSMGALYEGYGNHQRVTSKSIDGSRYPRSVFKFMNLLGNKASNHPTAKPVELLEWLVRSYSNENDTVLDHTMGSGSVGIACKNSNRKFVGIEMNFEIFEIAKKRLMNE